MKHFIRLGIIGLGLGLGSAACAVPAHGGTEGESADEARAAIPPGDGTVLLFEPRLDGCWLADGRLRQTVSFSFASDEVADDVLPATPDRYVSTSSFDGDEASAEAGTFQTRPSAAKGFTIELRDDDGPVTRHQAVLVNDTTMTLHQLPRPSVPGQLVSNIAYPTITYVKQADGTVCLPPAHRGAAGR